MNEIEPIGVCSNNVCASQDTHLNEVVSAWQHFLATTDWRSLLDGVTPIVTGCGMVYDLPNFLQRPNEGFAIVDMRQLWYAEPHYHPADNIEIYFVLQGTACVVVGTQEHHVKTGDVVIVPPLMAHFTIPDKQYVIAAINTPPFDPVNYIKVDESNEAVMFDKAQFLRLVMIC